MTASRPTNRGTLVAIASVTAVVALILALVWSSKRDDEASAVDEPTAANPLVEAGNKRPLDSGKRMLDADKASVSGTIRDAEGKPIAGATVCAEANRVDLFGAADKLPLCSKSEHDGHYRLDGLWPVSTGFSASAPQFIPAQWSEHVDGRKRHTLRLHAGEEKRGIDITLERGGVAVRGVVKDISGGVVEDAFVSSNTGFFGFGGATSVARTDAEGRFELWTKPGGVSLAAHAEGYAPAETQASSPTELATIFMTPESVIAGVVVHVETGEPAADVTVLAIGPERGETITDAEGRFRIDALAPGSYDVEAKADELYGEASEKIHLGLSESVEDVVIQVHPAFAVAGKVVIVESKAPCTEGRVTLVSDGQQHGGSIDEHGEVLVRAVLPGDYRVNVSCGGHISEPEYEPIVIVDQSRVELEWTVHTGLAIRGSVVDSNGAPVSDVNVLARAKGGAGDPRAQQTSSFSAGTEKDGSFELRGLLPGSYELDTWSNEHTKPAEPVAVTLGEAADVDGVRLVLSASGRLVGIVRDENGEPMPGVDVQANPLATGWRSQNSARTGDDGRFEIARLEAGSYRVQAQLEWTSMRAPGTTDDDIQGEVVEIVAGDEAEVELIVESRALSIRGRVVDSSGAPVSDAFIDATRMSNSAAAAAMPNPGSLRWGWDRQPVLSDQDGNFELTDLTEGEYLVRAYREGGGEGLHEDVAAGSTGVTLTIVDTGQLAGMVVLAGGGSPARFEVSAVDRTQSLWRTDDFFRTGGSFVLRELPPGNYEVHVTAPEGTADTEVVLTVGQSVEDLQLELASKITVQGRLVDADTRAPVSGMEVRISAPGGRFSFQPSTGKHDHVSDADGRFRIEDVAAGKVRMQISPRNFMGSTDNPYGASGRDLRLPPEPTVADIGEIELLPARTKADEKAGDLGYTLAQLPPDIEPEDRYYEVAVIRPGGPAENTGLALGDRIVEVDGRSVEGLNSHRYYTLVRAPAGTSLVLGIEGGKKVTLVLGQPVK
jgi:protocatechuate 3,4-dioxygenase beta subunit